VAGRERAAGGEACTSAPRIPPRRSSFVRTGVAERRTGHYVAISAEFGASVGRSSPIGLPAAEERRLSGSGRKRTRARRIQMGGP